MADSDYFFSFQYKVFIMLTERDELGFIVLMMLVIILTVLIRNFIKHKKMQIERLRAQEAAQQQEQNVFNISGRVQGQEQPRPDAFASLEHITIMNEMNKPPKYNDAPPSYEEAVKIAMAQENSLQSLRTEQPQGSSSTSTSAAIPAVHRTTE